MTTEKKEEPEKIKRIEPKIRREWEDWCKGIPESDRWTLEEWVVLTNHSATSNHQEHR